VKNLSALNDVDDLAATFCAELNRACYECEESVIAASANACTRVEVGSALADNDFASLDDLAAIALNPEVLGVRVASVASGRRSLFMCHVAFLPRLLDARDFHAG
jgi:hypothetical protein